MTFVAARQFGDRILIASDTMITRPDQARDDLIPGSLKILTIAPDVTIAFAGLRDQAVDAIRAARAALNEGASDAALEAALASTTSVYGDRIEFLIASHRDGVTLKRIWEGKISDPLEETYLGQRELLSRFTTAVDETPRMIVPMWYEAENPFGIAFNALFDGVHVAEGVGGFGISATCAPSGHHYDSKGGVACWDVIRGGHPVSEQQLADRRSGMTEWSYSTTPPALRGVAVVGVIAINSGVGHIYAPFLEDQPIAWRFERPATLQDQIPILQRFQRAVADYAEVNGGGIIADTPPMRTAPPTAEDMRLAQAYAAQASMPMIVELKDDAIYLRCGTATYGRGARIDFSALDPDPMWTLTETIDRLNAEVVEGHRRAAESQAAWQARKASEARAAPN